MAEKGKEIQEPQFDVVIGSGSEEAPGQVLPTPSAVQEDAAEEKNATETDNAAQEKKSKSDKDAGGKAGADAAKEKPEEVKHVSSVLGNKTIEDVIKREAKEEQDTSSPFSISKTLGGVMIARAFHKQIGLVLVVCVFLIIYISNRYVCQQKMVEIGKIEKETERAKFKAIVCTSMLTEKSRESNVMHLLSSYGDTTLKIPTDPPFLIDDSDSE